MRPTTIQTKLSQPLACKQAKGVARTIFYIGCIYFIGVQLTMSQEWIEANRLLNIVLGAIFFLSLYIWRRR